MEPGTKPQCRRATQPAELDEALRRIYSHYGPDLLAFFRDAQRQERDARRLEREAKETVDEDKLGQKVSS